MRKRSSTTKSDPNEAAFSMMESLLEILDPEAERQLGARISTELKALESDGILVLTEKGTSNFPNVYMKTSEAAEEDRGYLKPL